MHSVWGGGEKLYLLQLQPISGSYTPANYSTLYIAIP